jgi:hypothetical protein
MKTKIFFILAAFAVFVFTSCNRYSQLDQTSIDLADDEAVTDAVFEDIFNTVDNADIMLDGLQKSGDNKSNMYILTDSCPAVTITHPSDAVWPKTITIDYGTGCTGFNDNTRSGKINIIVTGPRMRTGSKKSVSFDNYVINGIKVEGTKEFENMGFNNSQHLEFSIRLISGKLTLPDGKEIERAFEHKREWIAGFNTRNIWDDECLVTGTANGVTINGKSYTNTIMTALHWKRACRFVVSGVVKIEREGLEPVMIDYGTGECDAKATVTRGDESKEIILRFRHRLFKENNQ